MKVFYDTETNKMHLNNVYIKRVFLVVLSFNKIVRGRHAYDRMVVGSITTC